MAGSLLSNARLSSWAAYPALVATWIAVALTQTAAAAQPAGADFTGYWGAPQLYIADPTKDELPLSPKYRALFDKRQAAIKAGAPLADPVSECQALGMPRMLTMPLQIVQSPGEVVMITEVLHEVRRIYTDGSPLQEDPDPAFSGHSVGHWEGDTLVIDTIALKANTIDRNGIPNSDQLRINERLRLRDPQTLEIVLTLTDPEAYTRPWTLTRLHRRLPPARARFYEYICNENNRNDTLPDGSTGAQ